MSLEEVAREYDPRIKDIGAALKFAGNLSSRSNITRCLSDSCQCVS